MPMFDPALAAEAYCYLTTIGRRTGAKREIEIWFGLAAAPDGVRRLYLLAGQNARYQDGRSAWLKNILADPRVTVRINDKVVEGVAGLVTDPAEEAHARALMFKKYTRGGDHLADWARASFVVGVSAVG